MRVKSGLNLILNSVEQAKQQIHDELKNENPTNKRTVEKTDMNNETYSSKFDSVENSPR